MYKVLILSSSLNSGNAGYRLRMLNGLFYNLNSSQVKTTIKLLSVFGLLHLLTARYDLVILHKSFKPSALLAALICRIRDIHFAYDSCDSPYLNINLPFIPLQFTRQAWSIIAYSAVISLSSSVFVPTRALGLSINHPNVHVIPDVNDEIDIPFDDLTIHHSTRAQSGQPTNLTLLWYGSEGSADSFQGVDELISSLDEIRELQHSIAKFIIVSNLSCEKRKKIARLFHELNISLAYHEWDPSLLPSLISEADYVYLPAISSFKTFYKSDNRVSLANMCGAYVICGQRQSYLDYILTGQHGAKISRLRDGIDYFQSPDRLDRLRISKSSRALNDSRKKLWKATIESIVFVKSQ